MTIDVTITGKVFNAYGQQITGAQTVSDDFGASLIQAKLATLATPGQFPLPQNSAFDASGGTVTLSQSTTIDPKTASLYLGRTLACTTSLTITLAEGLPSSFSCVVQPASTTTTTIAVGGNTQVNGAQTSLTRAQSSNTNGFSIQPNGSTANSFLVGGA